MLLMLTEGPHVEPVSLPELKAQLRIDHNDEDMLLSTLIVAARMYVEQSWSLALISQRWSCFLDRWPDAPELHLPLFPIRAAPALRIYNAADEATEMDPREYIIGVAPRSLRLIRHAGAEWPFPHRETNGVEIVMEAGFGAAPNQTPEPVRQALLLLASWWYEERCPTSSDGQLPVPPAVQALLSPYREFHL